MTMLSGGRRFGGALAVVAAVLSLVACDPAAPAAGTPSVGVTATAGASPSVAPTGPSPSPSASVPPTTAAPTSAAPAVERTTKAPEAAKPAPPAPTRTRTQAPAPAPTKAAADCYPLSNAGNCYKAGQICRKADVGTSGRDAGGRTIHCRKDSSVGQRWGY
ncbi:hypothetical protein OG444_29030 [Streptomyces sp. NBC_01232]|uniref:hypothetical protein n=1 Tax=unclassified Streptomyces TaxID=2593676 RepID=UPI002E10BA85|nr:hypothetical protein OG444_29030 [Streptomyces sp. NBC_01232]